MNTSRVMQAYRIAATILVTAPIMLNVVYNQDIITSLVYLPLVSLALVGFAMVIGAKLSKILQPQNKEIDQKNKIPVDILPVIEKKIVINFITSHNQDNEGLKNNSSLSYSSNTITTASLVYSQ